MSKRTRRFPPATLVVLILAVSLATTGSMVLSFSRSDTSRPISPLSIHSPARVYTPFNHTGWTRARNITIDNTLGETDLVDYQARLSVDYSLAMEPDFHDLRFTNRTGTPLPYWIQSEVDSQNATLYVRVPFIPSHSSVGLTMYYGNPYATPASSGHDTFDFFDDFSYGDNPANHGWTQAYSGPQAITDTGHFESAPSSLFTQGASTAGRNDTTKALVKYDLPIRNGLILEGEFLHNATTSMIEKIELCTRNNGTT